MLKVAFKFCGGCNPIYDRKQVYQTLRTNFNNKSQLVSYSGTGDILVILNGCQRGCIGPQDYKGSFLTITTTDQYLNKTIEETQIAQSILDSVI